MIRECSNRHPVVCNEVCDGAGDVCVETLGEWFAERQIKATFTLEQSRKTQMGNRGIAILFL
jgi:hypothetical protein